MVYNEHSCFTIVINLAMVLSGHISINNGI